MCIDTRPANKKGISYTRLVPAKRADDGRRVVSHPPPASPHGGRECHFGGRECQRGGLPPAATAEVKRWFWFNQVRSFETACRRHDLLPPMKSYSMMTASGGRSSTQANPYIKTGIKSNRTREHGKKTRQKDIGHCRKHFARFKRKSFSVSVSVGVSATTTTTKQRETRFKNRNTSKNASNRNAQEHFKNRNAIQAIQRP